MTTALSSPSQLTVASASDTKDTLPFRTPPHNIEAEQQVLGALLIDNERMHQVADFLRPDFFYEPVHQRIYAAIENCIDRGIIANPVTLKHYFEEDEALADIGGSHYLVRLAAAAELVVDLRHYARTLYDLGLRRELIHIGEDVVSTAYTPDISRPAGEQIEQAEQQLFQLASAGAQDRSYFSMRDAVMGALERAEAAYKNAGHVSGITCGLADIDRLLGGFQDSDLLILAGRPSMGKTALATNMAFAAARTFKTQAQANGQDTQDNKNSPSVAFFSLEMSAEQLAARMLASAAEVNAAKLRTGTTTADEFSRLVISSQELATIPFFIDDTPALSISALRTRARRLKRKHNLALLIVDYLQLLRGTSSQSQANRVQEISEITQGLKAIAKELNIPVIALSQLSRQVEQREDKRPQLSDLRESGSIEQDADIVMFVFREEYYVARRMPREGTPQFEEWQQEMERVHGMAEVIVAKQRHGPIGNVKLAFKSDTTQFADLAEDYGQ